MLVVEIIDRLGHCPKNKGACMIYLVFGLIGAVMGSFYLYGRGDFLLGGDH